MNDTIQLDAVETHNLKKIDVRIPHRALTVISGVSGSGKSSLAFDTLYAEGQRRFMESLSTYARQFLRRMEKPPLERVRNILPAVALQQKNSVKNARSTVSTLTEIADHLQLVFAHIGKTTCPDCDCLVHRDNPTTVADALQARGEGTRLIFVAEAVPLPIQTPQQLLQELAADGYQRLYLEGEVVQIGDLEVESLLDRKSFPVLVDRTKIKKDGLFRLREAIEAGFRLGHGLLQVIDVTDKDNPSEQLFREGFACNSCGRAFIEPIAPLFSFNSPIGACAECSGFGRTSGPDLAKIVPNPGLSLEKGAVVVFESPSRSRQKKKILEKCKDNGVPLDIPWRRLRPEDQAFVMEGKGRFKGVLGFFARLAEKRHKPANRILIARYRGYTTCHVCKGDRISPDARCVTVAGRTIADFYRMRARDAFKAFEALELTPEDKDRVEPLLEEIVSRLSYLQLVGLGYLGLGRQSRTLSGGEVQRIGLTSSLGRTLTDTLYVLDEPTAGLHARDTLKLMTILERLRDIGNAVVVVEHDPDVIKGADWVIELGPKGGEHGGELLYQGPVSGLEKVGTPTGRALGRRGLPVDSLEGPRAFDPENDPCVAVVEAGENNLQDITVQIPLGKLTCITGVSGSGKTSLVHRCLHDTWRRQKGQGGIERARVGGLDGFEQVQDVILMRQGGLGRSSRSTVASYSDAWGQIRNIFGGLMLSKQEGFGPGFFSFNRPGGRCERCEGTGKLTIEMHFMADIDVVCEDCQGQRFVERILKIRYRGKNISDVLRLTVEEALAFFDGHKPLFRRLDVLREVGLGYLRLGQTTSTLSGGEAQRLLLASYLGQKKFQKGGGLLFIFDEPTIGLHLHDISVLLGALRRTIREGHTVLVVEHNIDFIAMADHVIDLGPEGGDGGGHVVAQGTPAEVAACKQSYTGHFLAELLNLGNATR